MSFNKFNEVVAWYAAIRPMVSKYHKIEDDVRPIGDRKRKWERIRKVDNDTYLLLEGGYANTMYNHGNERYERDMAPIMWRREADGDYIYVRNGTVGSCHQSRYKFLQCYMPAGAQFKYNQQGQHWIRAKTANGYEDFLLPKTSYTWNYTLNKPHIEDDGKRLRFRVNEDGTFTRAGGVFKAEVKAVDKDLKRQWRKKIDAFYIQTAALAPLLNTTWSGRNDYQSVIHEWCRKHLEKGTYYYGFGNMPVELNRQIVEQEDHELRIPVMALIVHHIGGKREIATKEDLTRIKASYNRLMNKALGLYTTKEV